MRTHWHALRQVLAGDEIYFSAPRGHAAVHHGRLPLDRARLDEMLALMDVMPRFVFDQELTDMAVSPACVDSLLDMQRANVFRLPYATMVVEMPTANGRAFVALRDWREGPGPWPFYGIAMSICYDSGGSYAILASSTSFIDVVPPHDAEPANFRVAGATCPWLREDHSVTDEQHRLMDALRHASFTQDGKNVGVALCCATVIMSTRGVERETVDAASLEPLNRARHKAGESAVPVHTYIHVGRVYRSASGEESDAYQPRKSPRPHWRRGHLRNVAYGPRGGQHRTRPVYVPAMLVATDATQPAKFPEYDVRR